MIKKVTIIFFFFFSIPSSYAMDSEDFYGKKLAPTLYTHQYNVPTTTQISEEIFPFINTMSAYKEIDLFFSIEFLKYSSGGKSSNFSKKYDPEITNAIFANPEAVVIAQKIDKRNNNRINTILIPIKDDNTAITKNDLFALALLAGNKQFCTTNAQIRVRREDINLWEQLFSAHFKMQNNTKKINKSFQLNFVQSTIKDILTLVNILRPSFDLNTTTEIVLAKELRQQNETLNHFLLTGTLKNEPHPLSYLAWCYAKIKRAQSNMYQNFLLPIKKWYNYFYESYLAWKTLLFG